MKKRRKSPGRRLARRGRSGSPGSAPFGIPGDPSIPGDPATPGDPAIPGDPYQPGDPAVPRGSSGVLYPGLRARLKRAIRFLKSMGTPYDASLARRIQAILSHQGRDIKAFARRQLSMADDAWLQGRARLLGAAAESFKEDSAPHAATLASYFGREFKRLRLNQSALHELFAFAWRVR
jgi:transposase InsO family protein